jgi:hypothetical protein
VYTYFLAKKMPVMGLHTGMAFARPPLPLKQKIWYGSEVSSSVLRGRRAREPISSLYRIAKAAPKPPKLPLVLFL